MPDSVKSFWQTNYIACAVVRPEGQRRINGDSMLHCNGAVSELQQSDL